MKDTEERLAIVDFCDAAAEWGSTVPMPVKEAERMVELAGMRRVAVLERRGKEQWAVQGGMVQSGGPVQDGGRGAGDERAYFEVSTCAL